MEVLARQKLNADRDRDVLDETPMADVDRFMIELIEGMGRSPLTQIVQEHMLGGGKRLRAFLGLRVAECFGVAREEAIPLAAACELIHNATLIHDDLQDGDRFRRGRMAVWARHGSAQAINAGDLLLMMPNIAIDRLSVDDAIRWKIARRITERALQTVNAQAMELEMLPSRAFTQASYDHVIDGKTGALMALPVELAALHASRDPFETERLKRVFRALGRLFQIQDDVLDLYGDKGRKRVGNDLREGKVSALVVAHLATHPGDEAAIVEVLECPRDETSDDQVTYWTHRFVTCGTRRAVIDEMEQTAAELLSEPVLCEHPRLLAIAESLVAQTLAPIRLIMIKENS